MDAAKISTDGNLVITSDTLDKNRTTARAMTEEGGKGVLSIAINYEDGDTHSIVSGDIDVGGELTVTANQTKDQIELKRAFAIPGIAVGISSSASVGGTSTGDLLADIKEAMKNKGKAGAASGAKAAGGGIASAAKFAWAKAFGKKASDAVDEKAKKSGGEKKPSNVNEQLDEKKKASSGIPFNVGGALTIINDNNAVLASIGTSTQADIAMIYRRLHCQQ